MQLRDHPLVSYRGRHTWPPVWVCRLGASKARTPSGEVGLLRKVLYEPDSRGKLFLVIDYEEAEYVGCVLFDSGRFCEEVAAILLARLGMSIEALGSLDIAPPPRTPTKTREKIVRFAEQLSTKR
jgi:hypothetical protein